MPAPTSRKEFPIVAVLCGLLAAVVAFWLGVGYAIVHFVVKFW